jgi:hypothetical protein
LELRRILYFVQNRVAMRLADVSRGPRPVIRDAKPQPDPALISTTRRRCGWSKVLD